MIRYSSDIPERCHDVLTATLALWVHRIETPVYGITLNGYDIDFVRRPWPPIDGEDQVISPEREIDLFNLLKAMP